MNALTKASLRKEYLGRRLTLPTNEIALNNNLIVQKTLDMLAEQAFKVLHTFLPQDNRKEIDTRKLIATLRISSPDSIITVPYVIPGSRQMRHYVLSDETLFIKNQWGIPEPDPYQALEISPESVDVVVVPLLAFDKLGYRVGYGAGYYDRFLAECRPDVIKIGLSFFDPVDQIEDIDQYDIAMSYCVTPERVWQW